VDRSIWHFGSAVFNKKRNPFHARILVQRKRTLVDFRRGPLGPHFDAFAAYLKARGFSDHWGREVLGKCCQFNAFLIDRGVTSCAELNESLVEPFLDLYLAHSRTAGAFYSPRAATRGVLHRLFSYLTETGVLKPPTPKRVKKCYDWVLDPYLQHLRGECELSDVASHRARVQVGAFLEALGRKTARGRLKA
jgi:hypothetical protein